MSVLFDCRYVRVDHHDGISRFSAGLATELAKLRDVTLLISDERQRAHLPPLPWVLGPSPTSPLEPFVARRINRLGFSTVFSPMQTMGSLGRRYRLILTVHDLIYYAHPRPPRNLPWFVRMAWRLYHRAWWPQRLLLNGADLVATVSETTANLISQHRLTRRDVVLVPNAADALPAPAPSTRMPPERANYVYMGSAMPYKNVETLIDAMALVPDATLHVLSKLSHADSARLAARSSAGNVVFHGGVTDAAYAELLDGATALVSASRDEGFGIPLIEAGARGTPVVVSDIPIFREIAADSGLYFDPDSADDCARALRELNAPDTWLERSAASRANAARYSWSASAAALDAAIAHLEGASS